MSAHGRRRQRFSRRQHEVTERDRRLGPHEAPRSGRALADPETLRIERGEHECYGYGMDPVICAECGGPIA